MRCGRDAALVWDRAEAGLAPDEHERDCPHCTAVFADAGRLNVLVHRMAAEPVEPPPSVLDRADAGGAQRVAADDVLVLASPHGPARLSRAAAAAVLRHAVDRMAGYARAAAGSNRTPAGGVRG